MKHTLLQDNLIAAGVRNLKEFGYDAATPDSIMTDFVFAPFFKEMLNSNKGVGAAIDTNNKCAPRSWWSSGLSYKQLGLITPVK